MNKLTDKRVKKNIVLDTETAPYYEKVKPYEKRGFKSLDELPRDARDIKEYIYTNNR